MLDYFPAPYPDELFYSVLCRWYLQEGRKEYRPSRQALFAGRDRVSMGTLYPNATVCAVVSQIPDHLFSVRKLLIDNTPFPYYARIYPQETRFEMLEEVSHGQGQTPSHLWSAFRRESYLLRYCPCCVAEDSRIFGEAYYHVEHQIPLVQVCRKHHCRLRQIPISGHRKILNEAFLPLSSLNLDMEVNRSVTESEIQISEAVWHYLKLPLSIGPVHGQNNLYQYLLNMGFGVIRPQYGRGIHCEKLYEDLCAYHGEELVKKHFESEMITTPVMNRIKTWKTMLPDRYILIQTMLGLSSMEVFGEEPVPDPQRVMMEQMAAQGGLQTQKQVMDATGLKLYELNGLLYEFGLERFWIQTKDRRAMAPRRKHMHIAMDEDELEQIKSYSQNLGFRSVGTFAVACMKYVMTQQGLKQDGE